MGEMDLKKAEYYTNRELSWLGLKRDTRTGRAAVFYLQSLSDPGSEKAGAENYFRARESERRAEKICGCLF